MSDLRHVRFVRTREVCTLLNISSATLYRWIKRGYIPAPIKFGYASLWREDTLKEFLEQLDGSTQLQA